MNAGDAGERSQQRVGVEDRLVLLADLDTLNFIATWWI